MAALSAAAGGGGGEPSESYSRKASHAGSWYSSSGRKLNAELDGWLKAAADGAAGGHGGGPVKAVIAPHAGFSYSGPTAAFAYTHMDPAKIKRVVVLGPSHHVHLPGCAVSKALFLQTPVGDIETDQETTDELLQSGQFEVMTPDMDEDEHSIEMHLPYVAKVMRGRAFKAVTIMVGSTSPVQEEAYGKLLAPLLRDPHTFFVVSSDFCHWGRRFRYTPHDPKRGSISEYVEWLDRQGMALIEAQDIKGYYAYLDNLKNTICGRHPIGVLLQAMKVCASTGFPLQAAFVRYAQSSQATDMQDSSVSYASALVSTSSAAQT